MFERSSIAGWKGITEFGHDFFEPIRAHGGHSKPFHEEPRSYTAGGTGLEPIGPCKGYGPRIPRALGEKARRGPT